MLLDPCVWSSQASVREQWCPRQAAWAFGEEVKSIIVKQVCVWGHFTCYREAKGSLQIYHFLENISGTGGLNWGGAQISCEGKRRLIHWRNPSRGLFYRPLRSVSLTRKSSRHTHGQRHACTPMQWVQKPVEEAAGTGSARAGRERRGKRSRCLRCWEIPRRLGGGEGQDCSLILEKGQRNSANRSTGWFTHKHRNEGRQRWQGNQTNISSRGRSPALWGSRL